MNETWDTADAQPDLDAGVPVCRQCFAPVEPLTDYCAHCGTSVGQFTEYKPFENIAWQASGFDRLRRATLPTTRSPAGGVVSVLATFFLAPFLLLGLPLRWLAERRLARMHPQRDGDDADAS